MIVFRASVYKRKNHDWVCGLEKSKRQRINVDEEEAQQKSGVSIIKEGEKRVNFWQHLSAAKRYAMTITDYNYERPDLLPTLLYRNGQPKEDFCLSAERVFQQKQPLSAGYDPPTIKHIKYF